MALSEQMMAIGEDIPRSSFDFMDYVTKGANYGKSGMDFLNTYSKPIGMVGGLYSAYNQQSMGNKMFKIQKDSYNYNKLLSEREESRRQQAETNFNTGFANSSYGRS